MIDLTTYGLCKTYIREAIGDITTFSFKKVDRLPEQGETNFIYLVAKGSKLLDNVYNEYLWVESKWELIGDTQLNLDDYAKKEEIPSVPQWALAPDKPVYTAKEVGAQPIGDYATKGQLNEKLDSSDLPSAIDTALEQAKASGAFDGKDGVNGRSIAWGTLSDPTSVSDTHATIATIIKNHTRIAAPVKNAATFKAHDLALLPGQYNDAPRQHYWLLFDVDKVVGSQLQGYPLSVIEEGLPGAKGKTPVKGVDYFTSADKQGIVNDVLAALPKARGVDF